MIQVTHASPFVGDPNVQRDYSMIYSKDSTTEEIIWVTYQSLHMF
jgi:hypothetical protein